jgi:hypothetical protein
MKRKALFVFFATLSAFLLGGPSVAVAELELVSARDHVEGAFTTSTSGTANKKFVFLASALSGTLFVLENDEKKNFPLVAQIPVSQFPLLSVTIDDKSVFVAGGDGTVRAFDNKPPFLLKQALSVSLFAVSRLSSINGTLYVSQGQGVNASNNTFLYLSELNSGDSTLSFNENPSLQVTGLFGQTFEPGVTVVYNRLTGRRLTAVPNPLTLFGTPGFTSLYTDEDILALTTPGSAGAGITLYATLPTTAPLFVPLPFANAAVRSDQYLVAGTEAGSIHVFDLSQNTAPEVASLNLPIATGHTGPGDIEIRGLTVQKDGNGLLILAWSSGGNDTSRSPTLPTFFALRFNPR